MNNQFLGITAIAMAVALTIVSCSKSEDTTLHKLPSASISAADDGGGGREDDDGPIIIHNAMNASMQPVEGASIELSNGSGELTITTNSFGQSSCRLPNKGIWNVHISRAGYQPVDTVITVNTSYSSRTSVLRH